MGYSRDMPLRNIVFANNEIYHVLNRGVASSPICHSPTYYKRLLKLIDFYRFANFSVSFSRYNGLSVEERNKFDKRLEGEGVPQVEIYAYCFMPNHFHILLKQLLDNGIVKFMSKFQDSYGKYFNLINNRSGPLFQSRFKAVRIENDEQFLHVSRYIHLNPSSSFLVKIHDLPLFKWSSFVDYLRNPQSTFINTKFILDLIGGRDKYQQFVFDQAEYQRQLHKIKHLVLES